MKRIVWAIVRMLVGKELDNREALLAAKRKILEEQLENNRAEIGRLRQAHDTTRELWRMDKDRHAAEKPLVIAAPLKFKKAERMDAFRYAPEHALWGAVMDELSILRERHVLMATDADISDKHTHMELGIVQGLDEFRQQLEDVRKASAVELAKEKAGNRAG